ncbi:MAG: hypothetical protein AAGB32_05535 [Pseudomonadota bacterium]
MMHILRPILTFSHVLIVLGIVFVGQFLTSSEIRAQGTGSGELSGCATDTWTAMVNHAVNQTRRENAFNKRYIVKPDSILTYICFFEDLQAVADHMDPVFSGSDVWANRDVDVLSVAGNYLDGEPVNIQIYDESQEVEADYRFEYLTPETLEESLVLVVRAAWDNYRLGQFNHGILSGTVGDIGRNTDMCADMNNVWQAAKCKNFDDFEIWRTFEDMAGGYEPRVFPPEMPCL